MEFPSFTWPAYLRGMRKLLASIIVLLVLLSQSLMLQRCANPTPPSGGVRDTIGPVLVLDESTTPYQTNFKPQRIELTFDEWVKIKDLSQIIISPPLEPQPKVSLKKRTLIIDFGEAKLRDSVTYVINVGGAVVDLNEGNPPENLRFVFATGPVLDSASVAGTLVDAYTTKPIEGALLALYANPADTAALTENPFYFAKTNKEGEYEISNIRPGTYQVVALDNGGLGGYKYDDRSTKQVGFLDTLLLVKDGKNKLAPLPMFPLPKRMRLLVRDTTNFGEVKLAFDRPATSVRLRSQRTYQRVNDGDTLRLFYTATGLDTLLFTADTSYLDTFVVNPKVTKTLPPPLTVRKKGERNLTPFDDYALVFNHPLASIVIDSIFLGQDTLPEPLNFTARIDSAQLNRFVLKRQWEEGLRYTFRALPGALVDVFGQANTDTLKGDFAVQELKRFATLNLTVTGLDSTQAYVIRLVKGANRDVERSFFVKPGNTEFAQIINGLAPATLSVEVITDWNANGRYDTGNFLKRQQSEPVTTYELEALRANWEVEATIDTGLN